VSCPAPSRSSSVGFDFPDVLTGGKEVAELRAGGADDGDV
jgi:hypothetical protein